MDHKIFKGDGAKAICDALGLENTNQGDVGVAEYDEDDDGYYVAGHMGSQTRSFKLYYAGALELTDAAIEEQLSVRVRRDGPIVVLLEKIANNGSEWSMRACSIEGSYHTRAKVGILALKAFSVARKLLELKS